MTFIGALIALILLIAGKKPKKYNLCIYIETGKSWGGFSCGPFFFCNENPTTHIKQHESGHSIQNTWLGIFMPFIICIPSAIRYWVREYQSKKGKVLKSYDSIWFEGWATKLGEKYFGE